MLRNLPRRIALMAHLPVLLAGAALAADPKAVLRTYADIAGAGFGDSPSTAQSLRQAIGALVEQPSVATLQAARQAWLDARMPYQQTEAF